MNKGWHFQKTSTFNVILIGLCAVAVLFLIWFGLASMGVINFGANFLTDFDYVEYNGNKYFVDSNLSIDDAILLNDLGEYSCYQHCQEITVRVNGWFPKTMLLYNYDDGSFIFDTARFVWMVKNGTDTYPTYTLESIQSVCASFWDKSEEYYLTSTEIEELYLQSQELSSKVNGVMALEDAPAEGRWGTLFVQYNTYSDSVYHAMFYFSVTENSIFLMSLTDEFGFEKGRYCSFDR